MNLIETERLALRRLTPDDAPFILRLLNTPTWLQFIGDRNVKNEDDALNYLIQGPISSYERHGYGLYLVLLKEETTPIGLCGLIRRDGLDAPDIGFALLPDYARNGYGYESARAVLDYARTTLALTQIAAITSTDNDGSIRLLTKLGFRYLKMIQLPATADELMLFG